MAVVDSEGKVSIRPVTVGTSIGSEWIVDSGLNAGERVVAEGVQKVRPGMQVNATPFVAQTTGR